MKKLLKGLIFWCYLPEKEKNENLKIIRNNEWQAIEKYIKPNGKFLDIGCGTGFILNKVNEEKQCIAVGIDPNPGVCGVKSANENIEIINAFSEELPFENESFDVVYSSHVLEHVNSLPKTLDEISRVMKKNAVAILIVPTATLAYISVFYQLLNWHLILLKFLKKPFSKTNRTQFKHLFLLYSHSYENKTALYDLKNYPVKNWKKVIEKKLQIEQVILPFVYAFAEHKQIFKAHKSKKYSSSVAFICKKK